MKTITINADLAEELLETNLRLLDQEISEILKKWGVETIDELIDGAKNGSLEEAEDNAIEVQNLRDKRNEITTIFKTL